MRGQSEAAWEQALKELGIEMIPPCLPQPGGGASGGSALVPGWPWNSTCRRKQMKAKGYSLAYPQGIDAEGDILEGSAAQEGKPRRQLPIRVG